MTLTNHAKRGSPVRVNPFVGNFPCPLSPTGYCKHGGNKAFNYGFMRGTSPYCRKAKKWVHDMDVCPIANKEIRGSCPGKEPMNNETADGGEEMQGVVA